MVSKMVSTKSAGLSKTKPAATKRPTANGKPSNLSEEMVLDTDSESDDSDSDTTPETHEAQPNTAAKRSQQDTSTLPRTVRKSLSVSSGTTSDSEEEDSGSTSSSKKRKSSVSEDIDGEVTEPVSKKVHLSQAEQPAAIPVQKFVVPNGYKEVEVSGSDITLAGKVIWHITAPASFPIQSIRSLTLDAIQNTTPILKHQDVDYVLKESSEPEASIFMASKHHYKVAQPIQKTYNLRPAFTLPQIPARAAARNTGSKAAANIATAAVTSIRPQPKGLKMRFKPSGFGKGNPGVIGEDEEPESSGFQFPRAVGPSTDGDGLRVADGTAKKDKSMKNGSRGVETTQPKAKTSHVPAALDKIAEKVTGKKTKKKAQP